MDTAAWIALSVIVVAVAVTAILLVRWVLREREAAAQAAARRTRAELLGWDWEAIEREQARTDAEAMAEWRKHFGDR